MQDLNRRAGEALKDLRSGNTPSNSNEYLKAMDNLFAVCDEIEGNLVPFRQFIEETLNLIDLLFCAYIHSFQILVCETQKQMSKMEKIFDKDVMKSDLLGFPESKGVSSVFARKHC